MRKSGNRPVGQAKKEPNPWVRWLKSVRAINGLDQDQLAKYIGKSRSAVGMYETGERPIPPDVVAEILRNFSEVPAPPGSNHVQPIASQADARETSIKYAGVVPCSRFWGDPLETLETRSINADFAGPKRFMCKVVGDSCYPSLQESDLTIWEPDRDPAFGVIVLAQRLTDGACTVKQLRYDDSLGRAILVPINPTSETPPEEDGWEVVARLVAVIRKGDGPPRSWGPWDTGLRPEHLT